MTATDPIGATPRRREDARFLTGRGAYLDDLAFPGALHAVFLRSPHAHARIVTIDTEPARARPGVCAVLTASDAAADGLLPMPPTAPANPHTGTPFVFAPQTLLADGAVRYVGEPMALVVAESRAQALDAAEAIAIAYDPLPAVVTADAALVPGAPLVHPDVAGNLSVAWETGDAASVAAAFVGAAHRVRLRLTLPRVHSQPMEPRGAVGAFDPASGRYTLHVSSQSLHVNRDATAAALGVVPARVRFVAPDVGGGFGAKNFPYPEHALIAWAARRTGRAVKWIATRAETFLADHAARDHVADAALALDATGRFLALRIDSRANLGAWLAGGAGAVQTFQYVHLQGGVYAIPAIALRIQGAFTHTAPIGVTRGPGFAEANHAIERLIDAAARECGFDRAELRRRNLIAATPATNALGFAIDSGDFPGVFAALLARADPAGFGERRAESAARGMLRGLGFACHVKATGGNPHENVALRFEPDGTIALITGTQTIGQGHETTFPQILAERLGVDNAAIRLCQGDTDLIARGGGHGSSRATYMGGTAIWRAADAVLAKARRIAARVLGVAEDALDFADGAFSAPGRNRALGIVELSAVARAGGETLDSFYEFTREAMTFPNGAHAVEVEIDPETGATALVAHCAVDDCGVVVNPMVAMGQAHGAIAQGVGQALLERMAHDGDGQVLTGSLMDYALPRAADLPAFGLTFRPTRCTTNPLGVKGVGEAALIGLIPAVANAVLDALAPLGVTHLDGPATPFAVWQAIRDARAGT
ncbi:MAG: xanthine dehydrogenase family protein molybdopterin-binding subunit [Rhodospirillales bacterium]|nr:xanthine dehydrogenase family protein molybdopterin-binding subunit [Rhodospirillales bacterium]